MISAFDFWDQNGFLEFNKDGVRIYNVEGEEYLFVGPILYASSTEEKWYLRNVFPHAKGRVLEIGLGLGCASKVILGNPRVHHLLTVEKNPLVAEAFGRPLPRHNILLADVYEWAKNVPKNYQLYDFIFVDHYVLDDPDTILDLKDLAEELAPLLRANGKMIFWIDELMPEEEKAEIKKLWIV